MQTGGLGPPVKEIIESEERQLQKTPQTEEGGTCLFSPSPAPPHSSSLF